MEDAFLSMADLWRLVVLALVQGSSFSVEQVDPA